MAKEKLKKTKERGCAGVSAGNSTRYETHIYICIYTNTYLKEEPGVRVVGGALLAHHAVDLPQRWRGAGLCKGGSHGRTVGVLAQHLGDK